MVDKRNLNRIKGILSAQKGAEIPKFTQGGTTYKVKAGDRLLQIVSDYNNNNNKKLKWEDVASWNGIVDPNNLRVGQTITFTNPNTTTVPGVNPNEGNPNAAVTTAAEINANIDKEIAEATAKATTNTKLYSLSALSPKNELIVAGTSVTEKVKAQMNADKDARVSAGMALTPEKEKKLKQAQVVDTVGNISTAAFNAVGQAVAGKQMATDSNLTKGVDVGYDAVAGAVENMGPTGKIVGTAMKNAKIAGDIIQELGGGTDQQTTVDKWMDSAFFSWNIGMLNGFAGKNSDSFGVDRSTLESVGSSYGGTASDITDAASKAGKKYGLFSSNARKKANAAIAAARTKQNIMGNIADTATDQRLAAQSMGEQAGLAYSLMTDGGYNQKYTYAAKHGGMLEWNPVETLEWEPQIELNWELPVFKEGGNLGLVEELEWIPEFKSGGKTEETSEFGVEETTQKNVIPEGALHKNKHHMEHAEGLTKKGIPVIDEDGEQQAEIEHSEIIFTLEVTKKLEEYYEIFYSEESSTKEKEQAAIDAGKLLVFQILENTEDRTGLIESCKQGGTLTFKKTTDDLIEEALEWAPTLVIVEETEVVEKPKKASENKLDKDVMKEAIKEALIELLIK